jgi:hypothetical protein
MTFLITLWLPVLLTSVLLFVFSAMAWMVMPHHRGDFRQTPCEDSLLPFLREAKIQPGRYMFPFANGNPGKDSVLKQKFEQGPVGQLTVFDGINMGANMIWTYVFFLVTSILIAYLAWFAMDGHPDQSFMRVFRLVGTASILIYSCSAIPNDIWFKRPLVTNLVDGIVYGLTTGLIFAAMWPKIV